jgi:hypothetical protein
MSLIKFHPSLSLSVSLSLLWFLSSHVATARAQDAALLEASADKTISRTIVPSPEQKVGEVRLVTRGDVNVVQTLLYTKVLSRVVGEIRKKEMANWPADRPGHADAERYVDALTAVQKQIWERMPKDQRVEDRRQRMLIEFAVSPRAAVVMVGTFDMDESGGEVKITRREPLQTLDLSREYVKKNMGLIAADSFHAEGGALAALLAPLTLVHDE